MKSHNATETEPRRSGADLDGRYGQIGISAVVAALHYRREVKNPAYAPVVQLSYEFFADMAA
jgi:hypothetical protein